MVYYHLRGIYTLVCGNGDFFESRLIVKSTRAFFHHLSSHFSEADSTQRVHRRKKLYIVFPQYRYRGSLCGGEKWASQLFL